MGEQIADTNGIVVWNGLFIVSVAGGERLWDGRLGEDIIEPVEVRLVGIWWCINEAIRKTESE